MSKKKVKMIQIKQILRMHYCDKYQQRRIARLTGIARTTVRDYLERAAIAKLTWEAIEDLSDESILQKLFPESVNNESEPDWNN